MNINELKALNLHCSKDLTQNMLCAIYIDCKVDTYTVVSTDGHTMLWKEFYNNKWGLLILLMNEKFGITMPEKPESGFIVTDKKIRKGIDLSTIYTSTKDTTHTYPQYEECIPLTKDLNRDVFEMPVFALHVLERVHKTYKLLEHPKTFFLPKWKSIIGPCIEEIYNGWNLLVMPIRAEIIDNDGFKIYWKNYLNSEKSKYKGILA